VLPKTSCHFLQLCSSCKGAARTHTLHAWEKGLSASPESVQKEAFAPLPQQSVSLAICPSRKGQVTKPWDTDSASRLRSGLFLRGRGLVGVSKSPLEGLELQLEKSMENLWGSVTSPRPREQIYQSAKRQRTHRTESTFPDFLGWHCAFHRETRYLCCGVDMVMPFLQPWLRVTPKPALGPLESPLHSKGREHIYNLPPPKPVSYPRLQSEKTCICHRLPHSQNKCVLLLKCNRCEVPCREPLFPGKGAPPFHHQRPSDLLLGCSWVTCFWSQSCP
jgi:hypothetical protein